MHKHTRTRIAVRQFTLTVDKYKEDEALRDVCIMKVREDELLKDLVSRRW